MTSHRSSVGILAAALLLAALGAGPAAGAATPPSTAAAASPGSSSVRSAVALHSSSPCVRRAITFYCGTVPAYNVGPVVTSLQFAFGDPSDVPLFGDWNGDGDRTAAVFRPSTATWYLTNTDDAHDAPLHVSFGQPGDIPLAGDWDGNGTETIGLYRPSNTTFYLRNSNTSGVADVTIPFGNLGDVPVAGDFDGGGLSSGGPIRPTRVGVYRPSNVTFYRTHASGPVTATPYGNPGDRPVAGPYWCASCACTPFEATFGVFRPGDITWYGLCVSNVMSASPANFRFGGPGDTPLLK